MSDCIALIQDFVLAYDDLMSYLSVSENVDQMALELEARNVKCVNFYDVVLDYILIDSFEVRSLEIVFLDLPAFPFPN